MHPLNDQVGPLLRQIAASVLMPRLGALATGEVFEKTPGEVVTIADQEAEHLLSLGLAEIDGTARAVGEEACSADPALLDGLGAGRVWLIDPVDGTANFAAGRAPFGIMVALIEDGETIASWILDPVQDRLCHAHAGNGAFVNGAKVAASIVPDRTPIAALATQFMAAEQRQTLTEVAGATMSLVPIPRCAAEHYPRICFGENDIGLFQRTLPWDHAAGVLFLTEAGGAVSRWNGQPYRVDDGGTGLLAANCKEHLSIIQGVMVKAGFL